MDPEKPEGKAPEIEHSELPEPPDWEWKRPEPPPLAAQPSQQPTPQRGIGIALAIGYSFVGPVVGGIVVGALLDGKAGGTWTMVGLLVGTVLAFALLIRLVNKLNEDGK